MNKPMEKSITLLEQKCIKAMRKTKRRKHRFHRESTKCVGLNIKGVLENHRARGELQLFIQTVLGKTYSALQKKICNGWKLILRNPDCLYYT